MTATASALSDAQWRNLDDLVRKVDEDRWLSSRYASEGDRRKLIALYAFNYELARVRLVASEPTLAAIRFQWWRDALSEVREGRPVRQHETLLALVETGVAALPLGQLIDGYETALEQNDRVLEPEAELMRLASGLLGDTGWAGFEVVAVHFSGGRRGVLGCTGEAVARVPPVIRPAVAHGALRHVYARTSDPTPFAKRWKVLTAILTGRV